MMDFDTIVRNGIIANATDIITGQEIGIKNGVISCIGSSLPAGPSTKIIDAEGGYITPGGVDTHVHLEQWNTPTGDTWETGSKSAICGGTTTIVAFASQQKKDDTVLPIVKAYGELAQGRSSCDYSFHLIMTNPTQRIVDEELPLVKEMGISSVKLYMTYDPMKLTDREILNIMIGTRRLGMTTMIHAENSDMIGLIIETLEARGQMDPYYHAVSRPQIAEAEASYRAISLSELMDTPILLVHVSSEAAMEHIRAAQARLLPVFGETCPQYLYLLSDKLKGENYEGAKAVCSPPLRDSPKDLEAMWRGISNGTFTTFSSDHAPTKFYAEGGKRLGLINGLPVFTKIPNGLPGVETRIPLLFKGVTDKKITIQDFVRTSSFQPARLYGLSKKGSIIPGNDADLTIWYPEGKMKSMILDNSMLHHDIDYTPYEGMTFDNWPRYTLLGGKCVWDKDNGGYLGKTGDGSFVKRTSSTLRGPRNVFVNEWVPPTLCKE